VDPRLAGIQGSSPNPLSSLRVVLVDDDSGFLLLARRILRDAGIPAENIASCPDGVEAKRLLELPASAPSLILIDQKMPRVSGIELLEWLRSTAPLKTVRTYMLSTSEDPAEVKRSYQLGVDGYLVKPMGLHELETLLTDVLLCHVSAVQPRQILGYVDPSTASSGPLSTD
jgi:two-component system response regulator